MRRRPTVSDVAREAGVSLMTVSRVINAAPKVAVATRARVQAAIDALGFVPNRAARSLRSRRSHWIAVLGRAPEVVPRTETYSYLADLQAGVLARCRQDGYHVAFDSLGIDERDAEAVTRDLVQRLAPDGVILRPPLGDDAALIAALAQAGLPVMRIAPRDRGEGSPCVMMDDRAAAEEMTRHLLHLGHRRIGFVEGHPDHVSSVLRLAGYRAALRAQGVLEEDALVVAGRYSLESGALAARQLLSASPRPTAIFASNDDMAAGCLAVAHELGIRVPEELSVVGFDDTYVAAMLWPALTTVRQPIYDMGFAAAHGLLRWLEEGTVTECVQLSHRIIDRQSAGRATAF